MRKPWALALAVALGLGLAYLIWAPPAADLAAATYRSDLFARVGYTLRDNGWYAAHGHYLLGYSLLAPALGSLLGVRLLMVLSAVVASALFGLISERAFGLAAGRAAAVVFAFGLCAELLSGRVPYDLGLAIGLGSVLALMDARRGLALALALLTSAASPVAGAFLALVYLAWTLTLWSMARPGEGPSARSGEPANPGQPRFAGSAWTWPLGLTVAALVPIAVLAVAFPEGGYEPFVPSAFWPALGAVTLIALLLPRGTLSVRGHRAARLGLALYALALIGSYAIETPVGGNVTRLGPELAPALLVGVLWSSRRLALALAAPLLLYWQLNTPIGDLDGIYGLRSVNASYYSPLLGELRRLRRDAPTIVEVPLTASHWEAADVAGHDGVSLARGWERQLDTRYAPLFYASTPLTAPAYRGWLLANHVAYVALPDTRPDYSARAETALIARGLPYLHELWHSRHWRLYAVEGSSR